jgi:hypothetical protein
MAINQFCLLIIGQDTDFLYKISGIFNNLCYFSMNIMHLVQVYHPPGKTQKGQELLNVIQIHFNTYVLVSLISIHYFGTCIYSGNDFSFFTVKFPYLCSNIPFIAYIICYYSSRQVISVDKSCLCFIFPEPS